MQYSDLRGNYRLSDILLLLQSQQQAVCWNPGKNKGIMAQIQKWTCSEQLVCHVFQHCLLLPYCNEFIVCRKVKNIRTDLYLHLENPWLSEHTWVQGENLIRNRTALALVQRLPDTRTTDTIVPILKSQDPLQSGNYCRKLLWSSAWSKTQQL